MKTNFPFIPKFLTNNVVGLFLNCFLLVQLRDCSSRLPISIGFRNKEKKQLISLNTLCLKIHSEFKLYGDRIDT